jgi:DNA polymerase-3 subunit delta'
MSWNLMGHDWAVHLLGEHIRGGGVRHAYLFTGPAGVGKTHPGHAIRPGAGLPASACPWQILRPVPTCRMTLQQQFPDLTIVQAETIGGDLKVDAVRELQHSLSLTPYEADRRIAVMLRFQEANENAQNALLKTLEEAPGRSILLLTADTPENLLPTIVSRCELLRLRPLAVEELANQLTERTDNSRR